VPLLEEGLDSLGEGDVELRARLLARLAGALRDEPARDRRDALSREAVELARRSGSPAALAYALDGRSSAIVAPDTVAERLAIAEELLEAAERIADRERVAAAHSVRFIAHLQLGEMQEAERDLTSLRRIAEELRQPAQLWQVSSSSALLAIATGRLDDAETLVPKAFAIGEHAQAGAIPVYQLQRLTLRELRGGLEEIEPAIDELVAANPARPVFRCALVYLHARLGRIPEATRALAGLAEDGFSTLPFDQEWLYGMSFLAETAVLVGDRESGAVLYGLLAPWAASTTVDVGEGFRGSVSRYLGMLAASTERFGDAQDHFEDALEANERMGARPWLAHTQLDYAKMLLARGAANDREKTQELLSEAVRIYQELEMPSYAENASGLAQTA
jgi:tetratricopeptide (TPR) repeat protein